MASRTDVFPEPEWPATVIVVDAKDPLQPGTRIAFKEAQDAKKPAIFFINKLDEEHTSFEDAYTRLHEAFGKSVIPFEKGSTIVLKTCAVGTSSSVVRRSTFTPLGVVAVKMPFSARTVSMWEL